MDNLEKQVIEHTHDIKELKCLITDTNEQVKETSKSVSILAVNISKLDVVLEKMANMNETYNTSTKRLFDRLETTEKELQDLVRLSIEYSNSKKDHLANQERINNIEKNQSEFGCTALKMHSLKDDALDKRITAIEDIIKKIVWAVVSAVGLALIGLVVK